jgi:hypothetical protein
MSDAISAQGTYISVGAGTSPETYTEVGEVREIPGPVSTSDEIDVTHLRSPGAYREFLQSFKDNEDLAISMNYLPATSTNTTGRAAQQTLLGAYQSGDTLNLKVTYPDASIATFQGYVKQKGRPATVGEAIVMPIVIRVTGEVIDA